MTSLIKYEAARAALAAAVSFDEVKDWADKAEAMRVYARQAEDVQMEQDAAEIRLRAIRRFGDLERQLHAEGLFHKGGRPRETGHQSEPVSNRITLKDLGVNKRFSVQAQAASSISERAFEALVARKRHEIETHKGRVSLDVTTETKKEQRAKREEILAGVQWALPKRKFGVILADPEWRFEPFSRETGLDRSADNHYSTTATDIIAQRPVIDIAADDCCLFLWATVPMLLDALQVMSAWGFTYKSHCIWNKDRIGTGYWFRNKHELLLIGTRGNIPAPAMGDQAHSVIDAPVGKHSAKPEAFLEMIEGYFPNLPKIELNRRGPARKGWSAWGNEYQPDDPVTGEIHDLATDGHIADPDRSPAVDTDSGLDREDSPAMGRASEARPAIAAAEFEGIPQFLRRTA